MQIATQIASIALVLGLLLGAIFWLRRSGPGLLAIRPRNTGRARIQLIQCLKLSPQHSLQIVQIDESVLVLVIHPAGCTLLQTRQNTPVSEIGGHPRQVREEIS